MDHYSTLGVPKDATPDQIKRAYRKRARTAHPDAGGTHEEMQRVNAAYQCLGDATLRLTYDDSGNDGAGDPVGEQAHSVLITVFDALLPDHEFKMVPTARIKIQSTLFEVAINITRAEGARADLRRKAARVRRTGPGANAYQLVIEHKLKALAATLADLDGKTQVLRRALEMLATYEEDAAPAPTERRCSPDLVAGHHVAIAGNL